MIGSLRSDLRSRLRGIAIIAISLLLCTGGWAQETGEVGRLAEEARQALLSANQGASARQKGAFYQTALARVQLLEKFDAQDYSGSPELREAARIELNRLAGDGLTHDMLGTLLLQALLADLDAGLSGTDRAELRVTLHQIAGAVQIGADLTDPRISGASFRPS